MERQQRSGVLVYGHSFSPGINYVAIEIVDGELMASINFGYKALNYHFNETNVNGNSWYEVKLQHEATQVTASLTRSIDGVWYTIDNTLPQLNYLNLGETVYVGGGPVLKCYVSRTYLLV
ncbi:neurexin-3-like [Anneissia japonica]|uniref:neurexin-3-like n=1 Tax=Anneissia japonica TaxID=1529436 RepID=UPI001425A5AC|nr:neurexin-3-like [Anneissia japonica]